jgi:predicted enzyme related to lactoylglutathione lyase
MDLSSATIAQLMIPVADLDRAVKFYRDVLGLPFLFSAPPQMAFFQSGTVRLLIGVLPSGEPHRPAAGFYFNVEDIQAVHARLAERGVKFQAPPHVVHRTPEMELWLAEFHDPDGNLLAMMGQGPGSDAGSDPPPRPPLRS